MHGDVQGVVEGEVFEEKNSKITPESRDPNFSPINPGASSNKGLGLGLTYVAFGPSLWCLIFKPPTSTHIHRRCKTILIQLQSIQAEQINRNAALRQQAY